MHNEVLVSVDTISTDLYCVYNIISADLYRIYTVNIR